MRGRVRVRVSCVREATEEREGKDAQVYATNSFSTSFVARSSATRRISLRGTPMKNVTG